MVHALRTATRRSRQKLPIGRALRAKLCARCFSSAGVLRIRDGGSSAVALVAKTRQVEVGQVLRRGDDCLLTPHDPYSRVSRPFPFPDAEAVG